MNLLDKKLCIAEGIIQHYITFCPNDASGDAIDDSAKLEAAFCQLFSYLKDNNIHILQEKIYGLAREMEAVLAVRNNTALKIDSKNVISTSFIEGDPFISGCFAGVHIIGVSFDGACDSGKVNIKNAEYKNEATGRILETSLFKEIYLSGISDYKKTNIPAEQARLMFHKAIDILENEDFSAQNIVRTWIYFPRILDWYDEFNKARDLCFKEFGLIANDRKQETGDKKQGDEKSDIKLYLPASTGIQGKRFEGEECFMDVFGFIPKTKDQKTGQKVFIMTNNRQNEAYEYGSSFSRGIKISGNHGSRFYISGTASINTKGETVYKDDCQGQIVQTLLSIASLLDTENAGLDNISIATAYCKNREVYEKAKNIIKSFNPDIPLIYVLADVCRDDLLFEVDAIAITPKNS